MQSTQALNPYLPSWEYVPDAEPHIVDGRVYIYGSHDLFNGLNFCLGDYVCWSAPVDDLGNWTYHGCIYRREQAFAKKAPVRHRAGRVQKEHTAKHDKSRNAPASQAVDHI